MLSGPTCNGFLPRASPLDSIEARLESTRASSSMTVADIALIEKLMDLRMKEAKLLLDKKDWDGELLPGRLCGRVR